jgi:hypothetical protein
MAEIHDQLAAEGIVKETMCSMLKGRRAVFGRLYVTQKRIVFLQSNSLLAAFGALGAVLMGVIKPNKVAIEIPRSSVTGVARGKYGPNKNILEVSYANAEGPARFAVKPYEEWAAAVEPGAAPVSAS